MPISCSAHERSEALLHEWRVRIHTLFFRDECEEVTYAHAHDVAIAVGDELEQFRPVITNKGVKCFVEESV